MREETCTSYDDALRRACLRAAEGAREKGRAVLLAANVERVGAAKRCLAGMGCGFGVAVETFPSWLEDLWQLYGSGQQLTSPLQRQVVVRSVLASRREAGVLHAFPEADGIVRLVARLLRDCAPFFLDLPGMPAASATVGAAATAGASNVSAASSALDSPGTSDLLSAGGGLSSTPSLLSPGGGLPSVGGLSGESAPSLSAAEVEVIALVRSCVDRQRAEGLLEPSLACFLLAQQQVVGNTPVVLWDCAPTAAQKLLLASALRADAYAIEVCESSRSSRSEELSQISVNLYHPNHHDPIIAQGQVRFALPMGAYATSALLSQELASLVQKGDETIALSCANPYEMFCRLAPGLLQRGLALRVKGSLSFSQTAFGVAWLSLVRFLHEGSHATVALISDYMLSPFSFMSAASAQRVDAFLRKWRGLSVSEALEEVSEHTAEEHRFFIESMRAGRYRDALAYQKTWMSQQFSWSEAFRTIQLTAVDFAREAQQHAEEAGLSWASLYALLRGSSFTVHLESGSDEASPRVSIMSLSDLGNQAPASFDACVLADLTADSFSLDEEEQAIDGLLKKLGCYEGSRKAAQLRAAFSCSIAAARNSLLLHRPLKDSAADDLRPSALFDELVDCYRSDPQNPKELDELLGVPLDLVPYVSSRGEEDMTANCTPSGEAPVPLSAYAVSPLFSLDKSSLQEAPLLLPSAREIQEGRTLHLSASAVETYLECPFKWFTQRRLGVEPLDARLDALSRGNFAHGLLQDFHNALRQAGQARVTPDKREEAQTLLSTLFDALIEAEKARTDKDAYFATNNREERTIESFRTTLKNFVSWEAAFLPAYHPLAGELHFGGDDVFMYAGYPLVGSIDRVDVDEQGNAVVLDYKGSVGPQHNFRLKDADESTGIVLPQKVQVLIYAQVVRRHLAMNPVAALYLSYGAFRGASRRCAGLYDAAKLDPQRDLLGISSSRCETTAFFDVLDRVEELVAQGLRALEAGVIEPRPSDEACRYCSIARTCLHARTAEGGAR